jgi:hypothetical protein
LKITKVSQIFINQILKFIDTSIFGFRLDTDPEDREFYLNCPFCGKLNLDTGLGKALICKSCNKDFDIDEAEQKREALKSLNLGVENLNLGNTVVKKHSFPGMSSISASLRSPVRQKKPKKVQELSSLVVLINKDTLLETFLELEDESGIVTVNYDLLMKKILLPYFKIKSRIMKRGMFFKIGEMDFKVIGVAPFKKGVISSKTYIHCDNFFSLTTTIKRALMITTSKYDNFDQESLKKEILASPEMNLLINKNEISQIRQMEYFIRNCDPPTGVINNESIITIENKDIMNISKVKIAIIKVNFFYS